MFQVICLKSRLRTVTPLPHQALGEIISAAQLLPLVGQYLTGPPLLLHCGRLSPCWRLSRSEMVAPPRHYLSCDSILNWCLVQVLLHVCIIIAGMLGIWGLKFILEDKTYSVGIILSIKRFCRSWWEVWIW